MVSPNFYVLGGWWTLIWLVAWTVALGDGSTGFPHWTFSMLLRPGYRLSWTPGPDEITFEVQARTLGYVGFGLSRNYRLTDADIVIGWVNNGQAYLQDRHMNSTTTGIDYDPSQDYELLLGYENVTHTVLRFKRGLQTCDPRDMAITNDTIRVVWLTHPADLPANDDGPTAPVSLVFDERTARGSHSVYLLQRADQDVPPRDRGGGRGTRMPKVWELRNAQVEMPPPGESLYSCRVFRLPEIVGKHHLVRFEPLLENTGTKYMEHAILYECTDDPEFENLLNKSTWICYLPESPSPQCNSIVATWSRGSAGFSFPENVGYPLDATISRYFMLETHYSSPLEIITASRMDNSGLRLFYTSDLRSHDAGVLSIGIDPNWRQIIPPGQPKVESAGHCVPECTQRAFQSFGINVFAAVNRMQRIGRTIKLRQIRDNVELPPVFGDNNVDYEYQEYRKFINPVNVLPGDRLVVECTYNSSGRPAITLGGLTSREETCLVMALYFPRQRDLTSCHSVPSLSTVLHSLGIQNLLSGSNPLRISAPRELADMTLESRLLTYDWENQFHSFQDATQRGSFRIVCSSATSAVLPGTQNLDGYYPNISSPYRSEDHCSMYKHPSEHRFGPDATLFDTNQIEGAALSKVPRSSNGKTLGLSDSSVGVRVTDSMLVFVVLCIVQLL